MTRGRGRPFLPGLQLCARLFIVLLACSGPAFPGPAAGQDIDQGPLARILEATASYCRKFADASLHYVCQEDVTEVIYSPYRMIPRPVGFQYRTWRDHWLYDYQLIRKSRDAEERRILLFENGTKKNVDDAPLLVRRIRYRHIILGPMLMSEYWQEHHDYRIVGKERFMQEPCFIVEAVPKSGVTGDHLYGRFWVGEGDNRVWRIEWSQESIDNYDLIEETAEKLKAVPQVKLILEMGLEERGIRFPTKYVQREEYVNERGTRLIRSETTAQFKNYKFFIVETGVEFKRDP